MSQIHEPWKSKEGYTIEDLLKENYELRQERNEIRRECGREQHRLGQERKTIRFRLDTMRQREADWFGIASSLGVDSAILRMTIIEEGMAKSLNREFELRNKVRELEQELHQYKKYKY